jgi:hypothetical protein
MPASCAVELCFEVARPRVAYLKRRVKTIHRLGTRRVTGKKARFVESAWSLPSPSPNRQIDASILVGSGEAPAELRRSVARQGGGQQFRSENSIL